MTCTWKTGHTEIWIQSQWKKTATFSSGGGNRIPHPDGKTGTNDRSSTTQQRSKTQPAEMEKLKHWQNYKWIGLKPRKNYLKQVTGWFLWRTRDFRSPTSTDSMWKWDLDLDACLSSSIHGQNHRCEVWKSIESKVKTASKNQVKAWHWPNVRTR